MNHPHTYVRTFLLHKVRKNCQFPDHPPTPMSLRNIKMAPNQRELNCLVLSGLMNLFLHLFHSNYKMFVYLVWKLCLKNCINNMLSYGNLMNPDYLNWVRLNKISGKGHNFKIMVMDHKLTSHCPLADLSSFFEKELWWFYLTRRRIILW